MENLHNTSPSLSTTDGLVQLTEDGGDQLHALWSIYTVRLEVFTWKSGKIVAKPSATICNPRLHFYRVRLFLLDVITVMEILRSFLLTSERTVKFACDGVRFCAVDVQVDRRSYSTKPLHGRGSPLDRGRFPFPIARGRCSRPADVAAIDETLTNRLWKMSRSPELNWQPLRCSDVGPLTPAPRAGRVRLSFLKRKKRRRQHHYPRHRLNNIQIFPLFLLLLLLCLLILLILPLQDLAPSRCGRRIVVMLWSPSVHLPAAVTDCHDPLDMDGSIICLLISSTGVLDSYIARLVSCVSMEADKSSALIDEKLAANFYTTLTASAIQLVTALGKG
ncbi:hypothetical protein T05_8672 [Trichinella murrelli]|uniref:Uncharacterized protein n=1 Tax=Trichinella murrelli TaxID=144512 RepID=A0A0V0TLI6_9BILA|nr:hypothetical protein T05_8672 [Trichinella murrelli]